MSRLTILRHGYDRWDVRSTETVGTVDRLKERLAGVSLLHQIFRYREARILTHRIESIGRPLRLGLILRVMSRGACYVEDLPGRRGEMNRGLSAAKELHSVLAKGYEDRIYVYV
jgi:hypothetical protein